MSVHVPAPQHEDSGSALSTLRGGWGTLIAATVARVYLTFFAALAAIAFLPTLFGATGSVVQSGSMEPRIGVGDVVLTTPLPASSPLPVGRVMTFHADGEFVVHRLVHVNDDNTIVTKGDANPDNDSWAITRDDLNGQARLLVPYAGLPAFWLTHGNALALTAWSALTLLALITATLTASIRHHQHDGDDRDGPEASEASAPATKPAPAHRAATRLPNIATSAIALTLALATIGAPAAAYAQGFFSTQTRTSASWTARSYSPISTANMAGYAAVASTLVSGGTFQFRASAAYGSVATSPGTTISNLVIAGTADRNNAAASRAMASATAARTALNQRPLTRTLSPTLSGTLNGGVHASTSGAFTVPGTLVLDAKGDSSARFVFRATSTLAMAEGARVVLINGAKASNVWWTVGTSATLGTNSGIFAATTQPVGNYLVTGPANLRGVDVTGRVVSYTDAVTLYNSTITPTD
jgi:signal peptidase I